MVPNTTYIKLPYDIIYSKKLSCHAKVVYAYMQSRNYKEDSCRVGYARMSEDLGIGVKTIQRAIHELSEEGLIESKKTRSANTYILTHPSIAVIKNDPEGVCFGHDKLLKSSATKSSRLDTGVQTDWTQVSIHSTILKESSLKEKLLASTSCPLKNSEPKNRVQENQSVTPLGGVENSDSGVALNRGISKSTISTSIQRVKLTPTGRKASRLEDVWGYDMPLETPLHTGVKKGSFSNSVALGLVSGGFAVSNDVLLDEFGNSVPAGYVKKVAAKKKSANKGLPSTVRSILVGHWSDLMVEHYGLKTSLTGKNIGHLRNVFEFSCRDVSLIKRMMSLLFMDWLNIKARFTVVGSKHVPDPWALDVLKEQLIGFAKDGIGVSSTGVHRVSAFDKAYGKTVEEQWDEI